MRSSFFAALVIASMTLVSAAPLDARGGSYGGGGGYYPSPPKGKGGNAQSGDSGNANGGGVYNDAGYWGYIYNGPYASEFA